MRSSFGHGPTRKATATAAVMSGRSDQGLPRVQTYYSVLGQYTYFSNDANGSDRCVVSDLGEGEDAPVMLVADPGILDEPHGTVAEGHHDPLIEDSGIDFLAHPGFDWISPQRELRSRSAVALPRTCPSLPSRLGTLHG